jgi:hypothetical protein
LSLLSKWNWKRNLLFAVAFVTLPFIIGIPLGMLNSWLFDFTQGDSLRINTGYVCGVVMGLWIAKGERKVRDARQAAQLKWAHETFGGIDNHDPCTIEERARRFLEEALELVQSLGVSREESSHLLAYVYDREPGEPFQEFGGTALTLGCLGEAACISVCEAEIAEFDRVQKKSKAHFEQRHRAKMEAGL